MVGGLLSSTTLDIVVGTSMIVMALWALKPDKLDDGGMPLGRRSALATLVSGRKGQLRVGKQGRNPKGDIYLLQQKQRGHG